MDEDRTGYSYIIANAQAGDTIKHWGYLGTNPTVFLAEVHAIRMAAEHLLTIAGDAPVETFNLGEDLLGPEPVVDHLNKGKTPAKGGSVAKNRKPEVKGTKIVSSDGKTDYHLSVVNNSSGTINFNFK